ncbi:copper resistance protein CopC [Nonomuraea sp. NPDC050394]|uniref:copper resistance CopC family protein n=1 Tax=Nonomuraea sp. NPDC050394 TaxID=3364363 RepID=UPI0037A50E4D
MNRSPLAALAALLAALILLGTASPALAHDALRSSDPAKGSTVTSVDEVKLEFTAKVRMPFVIVRGDGGEFHEGKPALDGKVVTQALKGTLQDGKYTIAYRVVSSDGHPIEGEIPFTVKGAPKPETSATPSESTSAAAPAPSEQSPSEQVLTPEQTPAGAEQDQPSGFPIWLIIVVGALAGIGIGFLLSMRRRKP